MSIKLYYCLMTSVNTIKLKFFITYVFKPNAIRKLHFWSRVQFEHFVWDKDLYDDPHRYSDTFNTYPAVTM